MKKNQIIILLFSLLSTLVVAQDIRLQLSTIFNNDLVKVDSILIENISNSNSVLFNKLPNKIVYLLNVSQGIIEESTNIQDSSERDGYSLLVNESGRVVVGCSENTPQPVTVAIYNTKGVLVYKSVVLLLAGNSSLEVKLPNSDIYFVRISSQSKSKVYKALGSSTVLNFSVKNSSDSRVVAKSTSISPFSFSSGDSLQITVFKPPFFSAPIRFKALVSRSIQFILEDTQTYKIVVKLKEEPQDFSVKSTALRYDKQHALTYAQDDNQVGTVKSVLPLFSGGLPEFDTEVSEGRYITDGFGNLVTFKTNSVAFAYRGSTQVWDWASKGPDSYAKDYMTYTRLDSLLAKGGSLVSHQFWEMDGYADSVVVTAPFRYVEWQEELGNVRPFSFVKGGGQTFNDTIWSKGWFELGSLVGVLRTKNFNSELRLDTIDFSKTTEAVLMGRYNIEEHTAPMIMDVVDNFMKEPGNVWLQLFSHNITDKDDFLDYWQFKAFVDNLENTYGRFGTDKIWVPSISEMVQYLHMRDKVKYIVENSDKPLSREIVIDQSNIPDYVRQRGLTFKIKSDKEIEEIVIQGYKAKIKRLSVDEFLVDVEL